MTRKLFVTTALPYANAPFHIGHMMEYVQADIWVRFQRMVGNEVHFVCADDAHGAPIMIAAEKAGKTPQQFVAEIAAGRVRYLDGFSIGFDNWHSTDAPENHALAGEIYLALRKNELIDVKTIDQFFTQAAAVPGAPDQIGDARPILFLVLSKKAQKDDVGARLWFEEAERELQRVQSGEMRLDWNRRLEIEILFRQAREAVSSATTR
jgi:hypothetical protein